MSYVYKHIRVDKNQVFYIGIGSDDEYKRAYSKVGRNKYWHNITKSTEYKVEIISETWLTWQEACEKEKFWITFYGRIDLGTGTLVNMTEGGDGNSNPSIETRKKIRDYNIANNVIPPSRKGLPSTFLGKKHSEETKNKISISKKKNPRTPNKGKKLTDETKKKISEALKNKGIKQPSRKGIVYEKVQCELCFCYVGKNTILKHMNSNKCKTLNKNK